MLSPISLSIFVSHPLLLFLLLVSLFSLPTHADITCGGALVMDYTTTQVHCRGLLNYLVKKKYAQIIDIPLQWDLAGIGRNDLNPKIKASWLKKPVPLPKKWTRDRCSLTVDWVTGARPRNRQIRVSMLRVAQFASAVVNECIAQGRTQGSMPVTVNRTGGVWMDGPQDELRVNITLTADKNDPEYLRLLRGGPRPRALSVQRFAKLTQLLADAYYYYEDPIYVYP